MNALAVVFAALVQPAAADRLNRIPLEFWVKLGLGIAALVVAVMLVRKIAQANKVVLAVGALIVTSTIGFSWIYERNEPGWATPAVGWVAGFFPSKGMMESRAAR